MSGSKNQLLNWIVSIPFLIAFACLLFFADILQRILGLISRNIFFSINHFVNRTVLKLLALTACKIEIKLDQKLDQTLDSDTPLIVVANHQSLMDIAILNVIFEDQNLRFIAKKELARFLPYVSYCLRNMPHCIIIREDRSAAINTIKEFTEVASKDNSAIVLFPEGTRARDGEMNRFKTSGFKALVDAYKEANVIPVAINGSWELAKHKLMPVPYGVKVNVSVLSPVQVNSDQDLKEELRKIEQSIINEQQEN